MFRRLLKAWARRLPARVISIDGRPYLLRFLVARVAGCEVYLHRFLTADGERHLHDHPWAWSASLLLAGGYREECMRLVDGYDGPRTRERLIRAPRLNLIGAGFHRIAEVLPGTWTLFIVGPRRKMWGFLDYDGVTRVTRYHQPLDYPRAADPLWATLPRGHELAELEALADG